MLINNSDKMSVAHVIKQGYLKKLKTMKRKYFVLKSETAENSAVLEYYDSEKKWRAQAQPKRVISLKSCFNIQRRLDTKHKHVIALYTKEDYFCVVLDGEEELSSWLNALLTLHHGEEGSDDLPHPRQHVWQVNMQKKGLGATSNILGLYHLCLTDKIVTLVKIRPNNTTPIPYDVRANDTMEFSLASIRRCGYSECFFYMELGRSTVTGAGELWMHTEDQYIAQRMHATILNAMSNVSGNKEELGPKERSRSSSANEASKPLFVLTRRQTHSGTKTHGLSPSSVGVNFRGRSDSLPSRHCIQEAPPVGTALQMNVTSRPYSFDASRALSHSPPSFDKQAHGFDGVSTESIGSTASVDEVDCTLGTDWTTPHLVSKSIPEEESETPNSAMHIETSSYMEMSAPSNKFKHILQSNKAGSANHSRTSSLVDEAATLDGYMEMGPPTSDDGYVEMDKSRSRTVSTPGGHPSHLSPAASSCSVTSGTPSTDMRFSEFHLEKVTSYFHPSEEDECGRPIRAYSVGSRPECIIKPNRSGTNIIGIENRARAFSAGSRNRARPPLGTPPRHLVHPLHSYHHHNGFSQMAAPKSTSAPQLPAAGIPPRHTYSSSHGSAEPLDDLMEMDFSKRGENTPKTESLTISKNPSFRTSTMITNVRSSASRNTQLTLPLPITGSNNYKNNFTTEGYLEMSPGSSNASGYVEMRPADLSSSGSAPLAMTASRKMSFTLSPPSASTSTTPDGYVEMSWKRSEKQSDNGIPTKPITIYAKNSKTNEYDLTGDNSPRLNSTTSVPVEYIDDKIISSSPLVSPGVSPATPVNSFLSNKRSSKKQQRRNSKEINTPTGVQSQLIFPFSLNSPGSPLKPFLQKSLPETLNRKCSVDASSGTVKLTNDYIPVREFESPDIINTDYMETVPGRLSTVKEINEPTFNRINLENQKSIKQMLNNATKASSAINDVSDYVNIDNSKASKSILRPISPEENVDELLAGDYAVMNPSAIRNKPNNSLTVAPKSQNILKKSMDSFYASDDAAAGNQNILSSNPLASKTMMMASPLSNLMSDDNRRPTLVTSTGHLQPVMADFKPIIQNDAKDNREPRCVKSCSPKPVESALNRQLTARRPSSRPNSAMGETGSAGAPGCNVIHDARPSSVNSEKIILHYADLDLDCAGERSPRSDPISANSISSAPAFTYARIDFVKSEELRNAMNANAIGANNLSSSEH